MKKYEHLNEAKKDTTKWGKYEFTDILENSEFDQKVIFSWNVKHVWRNIKILIKL